MISPENPKKFKNESAIFFTTLVIVAVTFVVGIAYMSGIGSANHANLLADVSSVASPQAVTLSTTGAATSTASSTLGTTGVTSTKTKYPVLKNNTTTVATVAAPQNSKSAAPTPAASEPASPSTTPTLSTMPKPSIIAALTLPYSIGTFSNNFVNGDGWNNWWGNSSQANGVLVVGANASSTGGGVLLQGSAGWGDYTFQTTVDWNKGETFGLIARYVDNKNYVVCEFDERFMGDVQMSIQQFVNGKKTDLARGDIKNYNQMGGANVIAGIEVQGDQALCAFRGHTISTLFANTALNPVQDGEIGFTTWNPATGNSQLVVHSVGVVSQAYSLGLNDVQD